MALKQALVLIPFDDAERRQLLQIAKGQYELVFFDASWPRQTYLDHLREADVILGDLDIDDYPYCENLKWVQITWSGADSILKSGKFPPDASLCNLTGVFGPMISEYVMGALFSMSRRLPAYYENQKRGLWRFEGHDRTLEEATVLILGAGDVGSVIAGRLRPFVRTILGVRRSPRPCEAPFDEMHTADDLAELLPRADVVIASLPDTPRTHHLLCAENLRRMKKSAFLVNVGRGGLIPLDDLNDVMNEGYFSGVALDVTEPEPLPPEHPIWQQPRILITPHVSGAHIMPDSPTDRRIRQFAISNFARLCRGEACWNVVDKGNGYVCRVSGRLHTGLADR